MDRLRDFLKLESMSGILLFAAAAFAFALSNSPYSQDYHAALQTPIEIHIALWKLKGSLLFWVNEGLMTIFFLQVGLELKREFLIGELAQLSRVLLPGMAALGGMIVPALIYASINWNHPEILKGWAIPVATDIAFSLGVLSLFGSRVPLGLRLFLMTLAIFDDVGAIFIIAVFHTHALSFFSLLGALVLIAMLWMISRLGVQSIIFYLFFGLLLWLCVLKSGVHATVAGVLLAFMIPVQPSVNSSSSLERLEKTLRPWVAYFIMPLFALANAGVSLVDFPLHSLISGVMLGIILGLLLGKPLGVFLFSWITVKLNWASLPAEITWMELGGVSILCGIGFTMSLFLGTLAFYGDSTIYLSEMRLGVLLGSLLSGTLGAWILLHAFRRAKVDTKVK